MLLDSNILIGYLNGDEIITLNIQNYKAEERILFISAITVTEVLALASLTPAEIKIIGRSYQNLWYYQSSIR